MGILKFLLLTILIEVPVYFLFDRKRIGYSVLVLVMANCLTWPILNYLFYTTSVHLLILESGAVLVEAWIIYYYLDQKFLKALLIAFIQNFISAAIGIYFNNIIL